MPWRPHTHFFLTVTHTHAAPILPRVPLFCWLFCVCVCDFILFPSTDNKLCLPFAQNTADAHTHTHTHSKNPHAHTHARDVAMTTEVWLASAVFGAAEPRSTGGHLFICWRRQKTKIRFTKGCKYIYIKFSNQKPREKCLFKDKNNNMTEMFLYAGERQEELYELNILWIQMTRERLSQFWPFCGLVFFLYSDGSTAGHAKARGLYSLADLISSSIFLQQRITLQHTLDWSRDCLSWRTAITNQIKRSRATCRSIMLETSSFRALSWLL